MTLPEYVEEDKEIDRIEKYLIRLIEVSDGKVGFTGNAINTIFNDLKNYFKRKFSLKTVTLKYKNPNNPVNDINVYKDVIDIYLYPDGTNYCGVFIYGIVCQKVERGNGGKYYTYLYRKPDKIIIE